MSQKESYEQYVKRWWGSCPDTIRSRIPGFPKAPCPPSQCHMHMTYLHFSCLTCPQRRFQRNPQGKFRRYKQAMIVMTSASGKGFILPKRYKSYGLFIPVGVDGQAAIWKRICLKLLLSIAERIAEV